MSDANGNLTDEQERWLDKVQKLLAKAERAGTPEEAEVFAGKAQELMTKHALDEMMLRAAGQSQDEIYQTRVQLKTTVWQGDLELISVVAQANDVHVSYSTYPGKVLVTLTGFRSDVEMAEMMFASLLIQVVTAERHAMKARKVDGVQTIANPRLFKKSFRIGFAHAVMDRLEAAKEQVQAEAVRADTTGTMALVIVEKTEQVEAWVEENMNLRSVNRRQTIGDGFQQGLAAGTHADLGQAQEALR